MENTEELGKDVDYLAVALTRLQLDVYSELGRISEELKMWRLAAGISLAANIGWVLFFSWLTWGSK